MHVIGVFGCPSDRASGTDRGAEESEREERLPFNLVLSNKEMCDTI